jgi:Secretion system C-terminal sorting domain
MKIIQLLILIFFPFTLYAQSEANIWYMGYDEFGHSTQPEFGGTKIDFNTTPVRIQYKTRNSPIDASFSGICNAQGNILYYTNGYSVYDSTDHIMPHGDTLNQDRLRLYLVTGLYDRIQNTLFLQQPNTNKYLLFHHDKQTEWIGETITPHLFMSIIDKDANNGRGDIIQRNIVVVNDTINFIGLAPCRHANGRDWWVTVQGWRSSKFYTVLVSPQGVSAPLVQEIGTPHWRKDWQWCNVFSPDGSKYVSFSAYKGLNIYDFDRCTGVFSNPIQLLDSTWSKRTGMAFSPNARYLYASAYDKIIQYDTYSPNIALAGDTIARYDGFYLTAGGANWGTTFFMPTLAPDGKIYINTNGSNRYLHTIENPNASGTACNVQQHSVLLPTWMNYTTPNMANYTLGALVGSGCDTLTVATSNPLNPPKGDFLRVFPNPTNGILNIEISENIKANAYLYNALGQMMQSIPISTTQTQINTHDLPNGIYFLIMLNANKQRIGTKRIVVHHE